MGLLDFLILDFVEGVGPRQDFVVSFIIQRNRDVIDDFGVVEKNFLGTRDFPRFCDYCFFLLLLHAFLGLC